MLTGNPCAAAIQKWTVRSSCLVPFPYGKPKTAWMAHLGCLFAFGRGRNQTGAADNCSLRSRGRYQGSPVSSKTSFAQMPRSVINQISNPQYHQQMNHPKIEGYDWVSHRKPMAMAHIPRFVCGHPRCCTGLHWPRIPLWWAPWRYDCRSRTCPGQDSWYQVEAPLQKGVLTVSGHPILRKKVKSWQTRQIPISQSRSKKMWPWKSWVACGFPCFAGDLTSPEASQGPVFWPVLVLLKFPAGPRRFGRGPDASRSWCPSPLKIPRCKCTYPSVKHSWELPR